MPQKMQKQMNVFHIHAERQQKGGRNARIWLVIAESMTDAMSLVPDGFSVKAVGIQVGCSGLAPDGLMVRDGRTIIELRERYRR